MVETVEANLFVAQKVPGVVEAGGQRGTSTISVNIENGPWNEEPRDDRRDGNQSGYIHPSWWPRDSLAAVTAKRLLTWPNTSPPVASRDLSRLHNHTNLFRHRSSAKRLVQHLFEDGARNKKTFLMVEGVFSKRYKIERLKRKKSMIKDGFKLYVEISYTVTKGNLSTIITVGLLNMDSYITRRMNRRVYCLEQISRNVGRYAR